MHLFKVSTCKHPRNNLIRFFLEAIGSSCCQDATICVLDGKHHQTIDKAARHLKRSTHNEVMTTNYKQYMQAKLQPKGASRHRASLTEQVFPATGKPQPLNSDGHVYFKLTDCACDSVLQGDVVEAPALVNKKEKKSILGLRGCLLQDQGWVNKSRYGWYTKRRSVTRLRN